MRARLVVLLLLSMSFSAVTILPETASATTLYVGGAGPGNYTMIQGAIDAAGPGDTVYVYSGSYYENVRVNKTISLVGQDRDTTIVDGSGLWPAILVTADSVTVMNLTATNGGMDLFDSGLSLSSVSNCVIAFNNVSGNDWSGISLSGSHDNEIRGNVVSSNSGFGIYLESSVGNALIDNTVRRNRMGGIFLDRSVGTTLSGNLMVEDGLRIEGNSLHHWNTHTITTSNIVDGKPVYYWKDISGGTAPSGAGSLILANCTDILIESQRLSNGSTGLAVGFSTGITVDNITLSSNDNMGVYFSGSSDITIVGNAFWNNTWGIYLSNSNHSLAAGNTISENSHGIYVTHSTDVLISDNELVGNWEGMWFSRAVDVTIKSNVIRDSGAESIYPYYSDRIEIIGNEITGSGFGLPNHLYAAIRPYFSTNTTIVGNNITYNHYGFYLNGAKDTIVHHNNIVGNDFQAIDDRGPENSWDDGYPSGGNYWSDYSGIDNCSGPNQDICPDPDGLGDTPYVIDADSQDNYPLMGPIELPVSPPEITATYPFDLQIQVLPEQSINVTFSKQMNITSINWTIVPNIDLTPSWSLNDRFLTLSHSEYFVTMTIYTVTINEGEDVDGNQLVPGPVPNPWSFSIMGCSPSIESTDPYDGEVNVSLNHPILVEFSHIMDPSTLTWVIDPNIQLTANWTNENRVLELNHSDPFDGDTEYSVLIDAENKYGNPITLGPVPNPWSFTTCCNPPEIIDTDPFDGQTQVPPDLPINVTFSESMNTSSVSWTIVPNIALTPSWSQNDTLLTLSHAEHFVMMTMYTVTITAAEDVEGNSLIPGPVPNPWPFSTSCWGTMIISTDPNDQETDVQVNRPVTVLFDSCAVPSSLAWDIDPYVELQPLWSVGNTRLDFTHAEDFESGTEYTMSLYVEDEYGEPLLPGPVPNPWTWTTEEIPEPVPPSEPLDLQAVAGYQRVTLAWDAPLDEGDLPVDGYLIYRGVASGSLVLLAETGNETVYEDIGLTNGQIYFYRVSAKSGVGEGPHSNEVNATPYNTPPTCNITSPATGLTISGTYLVQGNASDPDASVERVEVRIDDGTWVQANGTTSWSYPLNTSSLSEGSHSIHARSFDGENYSTEASVLVVVDKATPPPSHDEGETIFGQIWFWVGFVVIALILTAIMILLWRRRKKETEEDPPE